MADQVILISKERVLGWLPFVVGYICSYLRYLPISASVPLYRLDSWEKCVERDGQSFVTELFPSGLGRFPWCACLISSLDIFAR